MIIALIKSTLARIGVPGRAVEVLVRIAAAEAEKLLAVGVAVTGAAEPTANVLVMKVAPAITKVGTTITAALVKVALGLGNGGVWTAAVIAAPEVEKTNPEGRIDSPLMVEVKPEGVTKVEEPEIEAGVPAKAGATLIAPAITLIKPKVDKRVFECPEKICS